MHYWDASALVPLCVDEGVTTKARNLARSHGIVTWFLSSVEIASAVERRFREGALDAKGRAAALATLSDLAASWVEVTAAARVRERALRALATHPLRAADAVQLAAALVAAEDRPHGHHFACGDLRLREAATREGFTAVEPWAAR